MDAEAGWDRRRRICQLQISGVRDGCARRRSVRRVPVAPVPPKAQVSAAVPALPGQTPAPASIESQGIVQIDGSLAKVAIAPEPSAEAVLPAGSVPGPPPSSNSTVTTTVAPSANEAANTQITETMESIWPF